MVVREQRLVTESVREIRTKLPFPVRGLDVDNDSAFINDTLVGYCRDNKLELTRCRAYKKNDQAWIEQKNGAVIRRMVGYGRLAGAQTAAVLNKLYSSARLYVNFFQPSFKLISKTREGAKVIKKYHPPATPCERLLARKDVSDECKADLRQTLAALDPVRLLNEIRESQRVLAQLEVGVAHVETASSIPELSGFVASLSTAWRDGEVRARGHTLAVARSSRSLRAAPCGWKIGWPSQRMHSVSTCGVVRLVRHDLSSRGTPQQE
jgi:hypothetical protein